MIDFESLDFPVHRLVVSAFRELQACGREQGFDMAIASGYRSFERQRLIWNGKWAGERPVLDKSGRPLALEQLTVIERVAAIMRWSAIPGTSRHHWGSDLDIYDRAAVDDNYVLQLSDEEVYGDGPFRPMHDWLDRFFDEQPELGFFRPYQKDRGGVAPERWHISFAPVSALCQRRLSADALSEGLAGEDISGLEVLLADFPELYRRYIDIPAETYPELYRQLL